MTTQPQRDPCGYTDDDGVRWVTVHPMGAHCPNPLCQPPDLGMTARTRL